MPTTTVTTGSPQAAGPPLATCVRERINELHGRGVEVITLDDFRQAATRAGHLLPWVGDHLLVLEGTGILHPAHRAGTERSWTVDPSSGYLR